MLKLVSEKLYFRDLNMIEYLSEFEWKVDGEKG